MFLTFELRFIILFRDIQCDLLERVCRQIYSVLLNASEFKEITEVQNAHVKILLEDDETRPCGLQAVPDFTVRAC